MASRLANAGFEVTLLEKNGDVGGRCRSETFAGGGKGTGLTPDRR
jgi:phytoene desaturase (3,4-didehydrolycopene-forming)